LGRFTVACEIAKSILTIQEVRRDKVVSQQMIYVFFYGNGNHCLWTVFFIHKGMRTASKRVEFINDKMLSYVTLSGHGYGIVLNVHAPTEDKSVHVKDSLYEKLEHIFDQFLKYHIKIFFGDLNAKVGREDIYNPIIGNESLHTMSNDSGVRVVNFATSKI
jgi:hypothetical protein